MRFNGKEIEIEEMDEDFLGQIAGQGTPANQAFAESIGPDYIAASDDGSILACGKDTPEGREIVVIAPEDQIEDCEEE